MQADQAIVGTVAIGIGSMALSAVLGVWSEPFRLRTILAIEDRWGKVAARATLGVVAAGMLATGSAILLDARPSFAKSPAEEPVVRPAGANERAPSSGRQATVD